MKLPAYPVLIQEVAGLTAKEIAARYGCSLSYVYQVSCD